MPRAALAASMSKLAMLELTRTEATQLLALVRVKAAEIERMVESLSEGEGEDLQRRQALRSVRPQEELLSDLTMKLEGLVRELGG